MGALIAKFVTPYEPILWAVLGLILLGGGLYVVHKVEDIGAARIEKKDAALEAAAAKLKLQTEATADLQEKLNEAQLNVSLSAPPPANAVVVRVCHQASPGGQLPANAGKPGPAPPAVSRPVAQLPDGTDIGPYTESLLGRCDAEVKYWRLRDAECVKLGICKGS
jgi:hypothetical protein